MSRENKRIALILLIYTALFIIYFIFSRENKPQLAQRLAVDSDSLSSYEEIDINNLGVEEETKIYVHISGNVNYPGLISLEKGQRLFEAIELAGGLTEEADLDQINLALVLNDQDKVYIPSKNERVNFISTNSPKIININTASKEELMSLSGIGEKTADKIIEYRQKSSFTKVEDLLNVPGIGEQKFNQIKDSISI